ncbi:MAG: cytochrome b N-terminal domain-containing protein [Anaerolineales bacterium]
MNPPTAGQRLGDWLEDRTGLKRAWNTVLGRRMPAGLGWSHTLGSATLFVFGLQITTGMFLALYYSPSPDHAYDSVQYITNEVAFGSVVRGLHYWGASAMIILVVLHMLRVLIMGAYKFPQEITWTLGVVLLLLALGFGFTGYLLPWDEKAYWATTVGTNIMGLVPIVGGMLLRVVRAGTDLGALSLTRFYSVHTLILPAVTVGVVGAHLYLVIRNGISPPPDAEAERADQQSARGQAPKRRRLPWTSPGLEQRARRLAKLKRAGKPFFPDILVKDAIVALAVLAALLGLIIWRGIPTEAAADPTNTVYVPRPEWYFMFLFEFLKYVPGELEGLAAVGVPTLVVLILFLLPFIDRSPARHPRLRPYAIVIITLGVVSVITLTIRAFQATPPAIATARGERLTAAQQAGRALFQRNCSGCHSIDGQAEGPGPDLSGLAEQRDSVWVHNYIEDPLSLNPEAAMPGFSPPLSHQESEMIASFLLSLHAPPPPTPGPIQEVRITAFQFGFSPDTITVKAGMPVRLIVSSRDVDHGIAVPGLELDFRIDAGRETIIEFTPTEPGEYSFECAVYCGTGHSRMRGTIIVGQGE